MTASYSIRDLSREHIILFALCALLIYMVLGTGHSSFYNAYFISNLETIFVSFYILISLKKISLALPDIKMHKSTILILGLWVLSVLYSYYFSPFYTEQNVYAFSRLYETFMHVAFFISIWHYLKNTNIEVSYLFYTIVFSTLVVAIYFYYHWINHMWDSFGVSLNDPPLNSHVRHTGYQAEAALSFFSFFLLKNRKKYSMTFTHVMFFIFLWGFLFWLGGRGTVLSAFTSFLCIAYILKYKGINYKRFLKITLLAIIIAMPISELLVVFPWNGLIDSYQRSISSESISQLSAGRIFLWTSALESLNNNILFGLGPEGYYLTGKKLLGTVQPHNVLIQFLIEWGVIGTGLFILLLAKAIWAGIKLHVLNKDKSLSPTALAAGAVICTLSINALTDGTYYHPQPSVYLAIAFAIWVLPARQDKI